MSASAIPFYQSSTNIQLAPSANTFLDINAFGTTRLKHRHLNSGSNPDQEIQFNQNNFKFRQDNVDVMVFDNATTKVQLSRPLEMGSQKISLVADPTSAQDASTKKYVDDGLALKYDATTALNAITLATGSLDMNTQKIINLVDPTSNQDASTKKYVDDQIATVSGGSGFTPNFIQMSLSTDVNTAGAPLGFWSVQFNQVDYHKNWSTAPTQSTSTHSDKTHYRYALTSGKVYKFRLSILTKMSVLDTSIAWLFRAIFVPDSENPVSGSHTTIQTFHFDRRNLDDLDLVRQNDVEFIYSPSAAGAIKFVFPDNGSGGYQNLSRIMAGCRLMIDEY